MAAVFHRSTGAETMVQLMPATVAASVAVLLAGPAAAKPLVLRCDGAAVSVNVYETTATKTTAQRFYRIDQQQFSRLEPVDVVWPSNVCAKKRAKCTTTDDAFIAQWRDGRKDKSVQINRKSGRVVDEQKDASFSESFIGDCTPSTDPTASDGPRKF